MVKGEPLFINIHPKYSTRALGWRKRRRAAERNGVSEPFQHRHSSSCDSWHTEPQASIKSLARVDCSTQLGTQVHQRLRKHAGTGL
ncbi:hypothetical protein DPX16_11623 [Anabarilius grahami]|uniref:Uncharacterized protein n=1 Tax=Anabarilius grahami TaxID=495550 RepID=A0A3N0Z3X6_ANAGA|nr:hypothetical protein DPX16_11623 [Anabarilius grahami]